MFLQGKRELEASNTNHGVTSSHSFNTSRSLSGHGLLRYFVPSTPGKMKVKVGDMRTQFSRQSFAICALVCVCVLLRMWRIDSTSCNSLYSRLIYHNSYVFSMHESLFLFEFLVRSLLVVYVFVLVSCHLVCGTPCPWPWRFFKFKLKLKLQLNTSTGSECKLRF